MKTRRVLCIMSALLLLMASSGITFSEDVYPIDIGDIRYARVSVPSGTLNLRRHASSASSVISKIPNNSVLIVESQDDTWCEVLHNQKTGFVSTEFLIFIEEHPYLSISRGDSGKHVLDLKIRMRELGYFRPGDYDIDDFFSITTEDRLKMLQKDNGLEETGIATPALQAFIFMGPVKKNTEILPPAPYYVAATVTPATISTATPTAPSELSTETPAPSPTPTLPQDLSVKITSMNTSYGTSGANISSKTEFYFAISGGSPPYSISASFSIDRDSSSPHTRSISGEKGTFGLLWAVPGSSSLSGRKCSLTLVVTDSLGHKMSDTFNSVM